MSVTPESRPSAQDEVFRALADPTRRAILERLIRDGEQNVRVLTEGPRLGRTEQFTEVAFAQDMPEGGLLDIRIAGHDGGRLIAA